MENNFNHYNNGDSNSDNNMESTQSSNREDEVRITDTAISGSTAQENAAVEPGNMDSAADGSSTGSADSLYSYSYVDRKSVV